MCLASRVGPCYNPLYPVKKGGKTVYHDLTQGNITRGLLRFALPMIAGDLLQQFYNIADTLIVGRALGRDALAAVGASYTLMTFLTSIFLGLSMGAGTLFSIYRGGGREDDLRSGIFQGLLLILGVTLALNVGVYAFLRPILSFLRVPEELRGDMAEYLRKHATTLLNDVLYTSSNLMHNGFAMSDRWN